MGDGMLSHCQSMSLPFCFFGCVTFIVTNSLEKVYSANRIQPVTKLKFSQSLFQI